MPLQELTFSIEYNKGSAYIGADALSHIPWPVSPREPNAPEHVFDTETDSQVVLDAALTILDVAMPTIDEVPPLPIEEIGAEERRDENLLLVRNWIEKMLTLTPLQLEGQPPAIRTYAAMREYILSRQYIGVSGRALDGI